jgi:mannitol-1-/sugar-/sorbitol-6-phosphatase
MDRSSACRSGRPPVDRRGPLDQHLDVPASIDCDVVLFDMDGTLVDSTPVVERIWGRWAAKHGIDLPRLLEISHGRPTIETLTIVAPHLATAEEAARLDNEESDEPDGLGPVQGAPELIASLPADRWGVVTSAGRRLAVSRLTAAGLPVPRVLVTSDDVDRGKPDPASYLEAARQFAVPADRTVVIEDTSVGVAAGRAAGATVIGVTTTFPALDGCDYSVQDLRAIRRVTGNGPIRLVVDSLDQPSR